VVFPGGGPVPDLVQPGPDGVFINPASAFPSGGPTYDGTGMVGSGLLNKGDTFSLAFSKAGSFAYVCTIHAGMGGVVTVVDSGQGADTQAAIDSRRSAQIDADLALKAL